MTSLMKMFVGCQIQRYLGPTIASSKHHWVMESPQIAKALKEDRNNLQKSFYLSQNHEQQLKEWRQSVLVTPQLCSCWVSEATEPSEVQKLLSKTLPETSLLVSLCLSSWGVLRHVRKRSSLPEEQQQAKSKGVGEGFDLSSANVCVFAPSAQRTVWPCLHEVGISIKSDSFKIS